MTGRYAENTTVSVAKSRADIETLLSKYGCDQFMSGYDTQAGFVMFRAQGRFVRFRVPMPSLDDVPTVDGRGTRLKPEQREAKREQESMRRWRALLLAIKGKLEVVESEIETFESAFAMQIVMPDGRTVGDVVLPQIEEAYETGEMPEFFGGMRALGAGE